MGHGQLQERCSQEGSAGKRAGKAAELTKGKKGIHRRTPTDKKLQTEKCQQRQGAEAPEDDSIASTQISTQTGMKLIPRKCKL